ncbi:YceI family protein [Chryseobacterium sp. PTM-20240506]|uniref:YceI family protein n=1 Tax=unclassified Chryseobacterium TaxID=2593645 RepID=UPI0023598ACB|nr:MULTISPECIES: YceI family protein [unclassified Chryseobacterium]MDC8103390.1 YceI family protein [Chryseobacterium sp. B21-037]MDQ1802947.1 YceI family protein [Chryseobacterium sp. CKR4-1]
MATKWNLDPTHSDITFKVKHMMISNVRGSFTDFNVEVDTEDDTFTNAKTRVTIKTDSISTNNTDRDNHLKSADFFNVEQNPTITFESSALNVSDGLTGNLTINGITKPVTIDLDFNGIEVDPYGNSRAGFSFEGKVNRKDFGLTWNAALETGGLMIGEDVKLAGDLQFVKQVQEG